LPFIPVFINMSEREEDLLELFTKHKLYEERILYDVYERMHKAPNKQQVADMFKPIIELQHQLNRELTRFGFELFKMELETNRNIQAFNVLPQLDE
jgi:hypothetical protein